MFAGESGEGRQQQEERTSKEALKSSHYHTGRIVFLGQGPPSIYLGTPRPLGIFSLQHFGRSCYELLAQPEGQLGGRCSPGTENMMGGMGTGASDIWVPVFKPDAQLSAQMQFYQPCVLCAEGKVCFPASLSNKEGVE